MKTILIVDGDVGFAFWLGQALDRAGYAAVPAESSPAAEGLVDELRFAVDLLVINPALPGAADFVQTLRGIDPQLKVVAMGNTEVNFEVAPYANLRCRKPENADDSARQHLVALIRGVCPPFEVN